MTYVYRSPEYFKTKFYQKEREFKGFENLTPEGVAELAKKIYFKQEITQEPSYFKKDKLTKYLDTLTYLTNPGIHMDIKTYDERIIYLIMSVDPELIAFKEFLKTNITASQTIRNEQDTKKQQELIAKRESEIMDLQNRIRTQLGFYDSKLIKYEEIYFKKFISSKEIIKEVTQNNISKLLRIIPFINTLDLSEERYQELQEKAQKWLAITGCKNDLYTAAYSCLNQSETIGLNNITEELVFFILISDPELDILRIYEEESRLPEVETRCKEAFNYYNMYLITLERLYHERYCPEKTLSPWTHM